LKRGSRIPTKCSINFDFSLDRIECKVCRYFETCLNVYNKAQKLAGKAK